MDYVTYPEDDVGSNGLCATTRRHTSMVSGGNHGRRIALVKSPTTICADALSFPAGSEGQSRPAPEHQVHAESI